MTSSPLLRLSRRRLLVDGIVQGVGFRPFVYNLARGENLAGFVTNTSEGVVIEVQGPNETLDRFAARLTGEAPPLADIVSVAAEGMECAAGAEEFEIRASVDGPGTRTLIPFDVATCQPTALGRAIYAAACEVAHEDCDQLRERQLQAGVVGQVERGPVDTTNRVHSAAEFAELFDNETTVGDPLDPSGGVFARDL